jgi:hypothetical protein
MLEMEKLGTEAASAVGANGSTASQQNVRAAQVAGAADWICHLDIVNLKQSVRRAALWETPGGAVVTTSIRAGPPAPI